MQHKSIFTLAVLSAALLPMSVAQADHHEGGAGAGGMMAGTQDVGEFRESLTGLRDLFSRMQENGRLSLASQDVMLASQYQNENRRLRSRAMGMLTKISMNWRHMDTPAGSSERMGTRDMARFAGESDDTSFVRNTVWQLQSMFQADKLAGRDGSITSEMMDMLNAAITRAENPSFRVAQSFNSSRLSQIDWGSRSTSEASASSSGGGSSEMVARREWVEPTIRHENLPARNRVATEETTMTEETTEMVAAAPPAEERIGAATLPRTGGSPELLYLLGSGVAGLGGFLLRRRR